MIQKTRQWLSKSIRRRVVAVLIVAAILFAVVHWQVERWVVLPQFTALQQTEAREDIQRCVRMIEREIHMTSRKAADWAAWDDTYQFVEDLNGKYAQSNLVDDAFISLQVDLMVFCNNSGEIVWSRVFDWRREEDLHLAAFSPPVLGSDHALLQHQTLDSVIEGVLLTEHLPLLISSMPIITSERAGPARGVLIMGSFLDPAMIELWSQDLSIPFAVEMLSSTRSADRRMLVDNIQTEGYCLVSDFEQQSIQAYGVLGDVQDRPVLLVQAEVPMSIFARGVAATRFASLAVFLFVGILLIIVYVALNHTLLGRIHGFKENVREIADRRDLNFRIPMSQGDEMAVLENGLTSMMQSLERSDKALRESEDIYRRIFHVVMDSICVLDPQGCFVAANPSFCETFGLEASDLAGCRAQDIIQSQDRGALVEFIQETLRHGRAESDLGFTCIRGNDLRVHTSGTLIRMQGQNGIFIILRDLLERREIANSLQEAREQVESAAQIKSGLLRNVTHEMRNPLNRIIGFAEVLNDEPLSPQQHQYIENIKQGGEELCDLINSIIDVSRIESGNLTLEKAFFSVPALLHEIKTIAQGKAQKKGLDFALHCEENVPETIETDANRLRQCIMYLVDNAAKFTEQGHVRIQVSTESRNERPTVRFDVIDSGPGIAPDQQASIFQPFTQLDGSETRAHGGLGTGLAIAKRLVELLGGTIAVQSTPGEGSTFSLFLYINESSPTPTVEDGQKDGQPVQDRD
ncbi:CHASE4 domain-containing protein [Planctomycetota bacterium]